MDEGESPLTLAARDADLEQLLLLLRERADPNVRDILGETPLFEAAAICVGRFKYQGPNFRMRFTK